MGRNDRSVRDLSTVWTRTKEHDGLNKNSVAMILVVSAIAVLAAPSFAHIAASAGYEVLEGGGEWTTGDHIIIVDGDPDDFVGVNVDSEPITRGWDYDLVDTDGTVTTVELMARYLNGLPAGDHDVEIVFIDGSADIVLTVSEPPVWKEESDDIIVILAIYAVSVTVVALIVLAAFLHFRK